MRPNFLNILPNNYMRMIGPPGDPTVGQVGPLKDGSYLYHPADIFYVAADVGGFDLTYYISLTTVQANLIFNNVRDWDFNGYCRLDETIPFSGGTAQCIASYSKLLSSPRSNEVDLQSDYSAQAGAYIYEPDTGTYRGFPLDLEAGNPEPHDGDVTTLETDTDGGSFANTGAIFYRIGEYAFGDGPSPVNSWRIGPTGIEGGFMSLDFGIYFPPAQSPYGNANTCRTVSNSIVNGLTYHVAPPVVIGTTKADIAIYGQIGQDTPTFGTVFIGSTPYDYHWALTPNSFWPYS